MGGGVSTHRRGRHASSLPPSGLASSSRRNPVGDVHVPGLQRPTSRRVDNAVVQARFARQPGPYDPHVTWATPSHHNRSMSEAHEMNSESSGITPYANSALAPAEAVRIPYTPEGGLPPVSSAKQLPSSLP